MKKRLLSILVAAAIFMGSATNTYASSALDLFDISADENDIIIDDVIIEEDDETEDSSTDSSLDSIEDAIVIIDEEEDDSAASAKTSSDEATDSSTDAPNSASGYKVTLNSNGGNVTPGSITISATTYSSLPTPKRTGYTFKGWNTKKDGSGTKVKNGSKLTKKANHTLYAQWAAIQYTIQFNKNGGSGTMTAISATYDKPVTLTKNAFKRTGYKFNGWNTKKDGTGTKYADAATVENLSSKSGATVTLYAQWKVLSYKVTFNSKGGSEVAAQTVKYNTSSKQYGVAKEPEATTKKGYTFKGWFTDTELTTAYDFSTPVKKSFTLYAKWAANKYTVKFKANGGTGSMKSMSFKYGKAQTLTANTFTREGYTFGGWNTKADGSGKAYADQASVKNLSSKSGATVTLYAQWDDGFTKISLGAKARTQAEIKSYLAANTVKDSFSYGKKPSLSEPYAPGSLSTTALNGALTVLNNVRYVAGVSNDITLNSEYNDGAQKIAFLNYLNGSVSHYPSRPSVLRDSKYDQLYTDGYVAGGESNLAWTSWEADLEYSIIKQWMVDSSNNSRTTVGHRRWVLYPGLHEVGFGRVGGYASVYIHGGFMGDSGVSVAWPAQNTPVSYFASDSPWSLSMGRIVDKDNLDLQVVRKSDGKTWHFNKTTTDGLFYVDNNYYGDRGCIIFAPDNITSNAGESYTITARFIERNESLTYTVNFF